MNTRMKPATGWNYRVTICDENGIYANDDLFLLEQLPGKVDMLIKVLRVKILIEEKEK